MSAADGRTLTLVEALGGRAAERGKGSWLHAGSMTTLHCNPGNCVSCDDAAGRSLQDEPPPAPEALVRLLGQVTATPALP